MGPESGILAICRGCWPGNHGIVGIVVAEVVHLGGIVMAEQITVSVDSDVADLYRSASDNERRKLDLLVNLRLRDAKESGKSLRDTMLEISRNAQRRGLTPEILQSILDEE